MDRNQVKKIVFLADCLTTQNAGIYQYALQLITRIVKYYPENSYFSITTKAYELDNVQNIIVPVNSSIPFHLQLRNFIEIPRKVRSLRSDIVFELAHFGPFFLPKQVKRVTIVHDLTPISHPQFHDRLSVIMHKMLLPKILGNADYIITNSNTTKADILNYRPLPSNKVIVCYPALKSPNNASKRSLSNNKVNLLTVSTIEPRKNHLQILKAFEIACDQGSNATWTIVGKKGWKSEPFLFALEKSIYRNHIYLKGFVTSEELEQHYVESDAFVFASHHEGFGIPIAEAMIREIPLILSDTIIHREVAGGSAKFFKNEPELSQLIINLYDAKRQETSNETQERIATYLDDRIDLGVIMS